jgi:eukaryotic-like serine/threonine-protein kinase
MALVSIYRPGNWRQDGFASLRPDPALQSAQIIARKLRIKQDGPTGIWLNAIAPAAGNGTRVELLDVRRESIAACRPWTGNALAAWLGWEGPTPVLKQGEEVTLRLTFTGGGFRLYAMGVHNAKKGSAPLSSSPVPGARADKRVRWVFSAQRKIWSSPVCDNNQVYFGFWDQNLYSLDSETGTLRCKFATGNAIAATPAVHNGFVYTVSHDGYLYCLEGPSGRLRWKVPVSNNGNNYSANLDWVDSSPAIGAYTVGPTSGSARLSRLFVGCHNRDLNAFNLEDGTEEWRFPTFNWILSHRAIDAYKVFVSSLDGRIYAVDARCGGMLWMYKIGEYLRYSSSLVPDTVFDEGAAGSPLVVDDSLYWGADDGFLYALDSKTGRERWVFQTGKWIWGRQLLNGETLVVPSADAHVYGLNADSEKRIWELQTENANYANVVLHGNLALIACSSGRLYAVDPATGNVAWTFQAEGGLRAGPAVGADRTVYLSKCKGTVYAFAP